MIKLPTTSGYCVEWDKEETITKRSGQVVHLRGCYETIDLDDAKKVKSEKESAGFNNVTLCECIF